MPKSTCQNCDRNVVLVKIGDDLVATDTELIQVIPARLAAGPGGVIRMADRTTTARRLHADLCETYKIQGQKQKIAAEQREYNRKHGRQRAPARNHGL